jgi:hypothetical protein
MVIDNLDIVGIAVPLENYSVLAIDANGPIPGQIALQFLQPVRGGNTQIVKTRSDFQSQQFPMGGPDYACRKFFDALIIENGFRPGATE